MATITAAQSGLWSDPDTWTGGVLPGPNDIARSTSGFTVTIDQDVEVTTISSNAGYFLVDNIPSTRTITGDITAVTSTTGLTVTALSGTLIINGNVTAPPNNGMPGIGGFVANSVLTIVINGNVSANTGGNTFGLYNNAATLFLTINGNVIGNAAHGLILTAPSFVRVNGNVTAGITGQGINMTSVGTLTVTGSVIAQSSSGVSSSNANVVIDLQGAVTSTDANYGASFSTAGLVRVSGPLYNAPNGRTAILCNTMAIPEGQNLIWNVQDDLDAAVALTNFTASSPIPSNVRKGTSYGLANSLKGTMNVPSPSTVSSGVSVDDTIGTAVLTASQLWDHEINAGVAAKTRLLAVSTDASAATQIAGGLDG